MHNALPRHLHTFPSFFPSTAIPPFAFHAGFYTKAYSRVPCTHRTAKYPLRTNEEENSMWCCLEQNAIKTKTALCFIHSFIHSFTDILWHNPLQYLPIAKRIKSARNHLHGARCSCDVDGQKNKKERRGKEAHVLCDRGAPAPFSRSQEP